MKKRYVILLGVVLAIAAIYTYIWCVANSNGDRFIGAKNIPCIDGVKVKFYQGTENLERYQSLSYVFVSPLGSESAWQSAGGTDNFDGVVLADFQLTCADSNVIIAYTPERADTFSLDTIAQMLK